MAGGVCVMEERRPSMTFEIPQSGVILGGSVGLGGRNLAADVRLVQGLLNLVRSFLNSSGPPLSVDGIVGPLTIAAIQRFQSAMLGFADGRIDPHGPTLARLNVLAPPQGIETVTSGRPLAVGDNLPKAPKPPIEAAFDAVPQAKIWVIAALAHIAPIRVGMINSGLPVLPIVFSIINVHFHLDRDPNSTLTNLDKINSVFLRIARVLDDPHRFFREGPSTPKSKFADAPTGGFSSGNNEFITFRTEYPFCGRMCQAAMIVHEGAHYCGAKDEIIHFAHEFPKFDGEPQDNGTHNYADMPTSEALRNAASYAAFAIHAAFLQDLRFGLDNKSV